MVQGLRGARRRPAAHRHEPYALCGAALTRRSAGGAPDHHRQSQGLHLRAVCPHRLALFGLLRVACLHPLDAQLQREPPLLPPRRDLVVLQPPDGRRLLPHVGRTLQPRAARLQQARRGGRLRCAPHVPATQDTAAPTEERRPAGDLLPRGGTSHRWHREQGGLRGDRPARRGREHQRHLRHWRQTHHHQDRAHGPWSLHGDASRQAPQHHLQLARQAVDRQAAQAGRGWRSPAAGRLAPHHCHGTAAARQGVCREHHLPRSAEALPAAEPAKQRHHHHRPATAKPAFWRGRHHPLRQRRADSCRQAMLREQPRARRRPHHRPRGEQQNLRPLRAHLAAHTAARG